MAATVIPILSTPDVERLRTFYTQLFAASETTRVPDDGPIFYLGLRIGGSEIGIVARDDANTGSARATGQRMLLSIDVAEVDSSLERVESLGGHALGPANDMPWGQRVAHIEDPDGNAVNLTQQLDE